MVVPRSGRRHEEADERAFVAWSSQQIRRHAYRLEKLPFISSSRVFPQNPLQPPRRRPQERKASKERDGIYPPDGQGYILQ